MSRILGTPDTLFDYDVITIMTDNYAFMNGIDYVRYPCLGLIEI